MQKVAVYDLPTRAFHLLFGVLFVSSFSIGKFIDDDSKLYAYHMLSGMTMLFIALLRVIWGLVGTKYAKFSSFQLSPSALISYFVSLLGTKTKRELGHNPASSYAAIGMMLLTLFLVLTGLLMVNRVAKEFFEEVHELFAFGFLLIVILHIAGVLFHQLRHKDGMMFSIFTGKKDRVEGQAPISKQAPVVLIIFLLFTFTFAANLFSSYDSKLGRLNLFGSQLQLGEVENEHNVDYYNKYYGTQK
jgi:cytochrome b